MHTKCTCKTKNSLQNHLDAYLGIFIPSKEMFHSNVGICSVVNGYNIKKIKHKPFVKTEFTKENFCYSYIILHKCIFMYSTGIFFYQREMHQIYLIGPLHPNISMHILQTVLYIIPNVLTKRIVLQSRVSLVGDHLLHSCDLNV